MSDSPNGDMLDSVLALLVDNALATNANAIPLLSEHPEDFFAIKDDGADVIFSPLGDITLNFTDELTFPAAGDSLIEPCISLRETKHDDPATTSTPQQLAETPSFRAADTVDDNKPRTDPNRARNERRQEIRGLRSEVMELTEHLSTLKAVSGRDSESQAIWANVAQQTFRVPSLWEAICRNQLIRRVHSERENARLKRTLDEQNRLMCSLGRAIKRPASGLRNATCPDLYASERVYTLSANSEEDTKRFGMLVEEINASYCEIDEIFEMNGIAGSHTEPRRGSHMRENKHGRYVDMFSSDVLPFPLKNTAEVVWHFYSGSTKHRGPIYYKDAQKLESCDDIVVEKFALELSATSMRVDFRVWQVMRRYVEADRVVVVWAGVVEPIEFANKPFAGCRFREKGYVVCRTVNTQPDEHPTFGIRYTQLQRVHRIVPYTVHEQDRNLTPTDKHEIGAVIDFVMSLDSISAHLEMFEDELMRRSIK